MMLNKQQLALIEEETRRLLEKLEMRGEVRVEQTENPDEPTVRVALHVAEPQAIIGEDGQTLFEFQHILKLILRKKIGEPFYLSLDVNDYKKTKEEYLRELALTTADEVALLKKSKELPPMPSAERRAIHMAIAEREDVVSESAGEGVERRVVIRPKE